MTVLLSIFILPALLLAMLVIPVVVALIYKGSYTNHLNQMMMGDVAGKKWISPFALGAIIFLIEVLILVGCFGLFMMRRDTHSQREIDASDNYSWTWPEGEVPEGEYRGFNGDPVDGYDILQRDEDAFHYTVYKRSASGDESGPDYAICISYNGEGEVKSYLANVQFEDNTGSSGFGNVGTADDKYIGVIDTQNIVVRSIIDDPEKGKEIEVLDDVKFDVIYNFDVYDMDYDNMIDTEPHKMASLSINLSDLRF